MVRCQINRQTILQRTYRLHKAALPIPSNSEPKLIKKKTKNLWRETPQTNKKEKDKIKQQWKLKHTEHLWSKYN